MGQEATSQPGLARLALKISGLEGELWHTEPMHATISATLPIEGPQPAVYRAGPSLRTAQPEQEPPITVSERSLVIPRELQNIAVQNDRNSETVTLLCPRFFDGHDLSGYSFYLRTVNSVGGYDPVSLTPRASGTEIQMEWTLRPRKILELIYRHGLTSIEIADRLGYSERTVNREHRAILEKAMAVLL